MAMRGAERLPALGCAATGVGSLPHRNTAAALRFVARTAPLVPYRPELVGRSDTIAGQPRGRAEFLRAFAEGLFPQARALKGQVCGPLTGAVVRKQSISEALAEQLVQAEAEASGLSRPGLPVIVVVDEPCLGQLQPGDRVEVIAAIRALFGVIEDAGAAPGLHCCDAMDLALLMELEPAVWSFDAFHGLEAAMAHPAVQGWLAAGGRPIFGMVPTRGVGAGLAERLAGVPEAIRAGALVSASCGLGTLTLARARRVAAAVRRLGDLPLLR